MINRILVIALAAMAAGCHEGGPSCYWRPDTKERQELFRQCMELLPAGPESTHYNDWSEVVDSCSDYSYRAATQIKKCQ